MNPQLRRNGQSSLPSLSTWLVVFLIIFLLVMVLVFSQYRKKLKSHPGAMQELMLGSAGASLFDFIEDPWGNENEKRRRHENYFFTPPPQIQLPKHRPFDLTPRAPQERGALRPIQGYGFALADQIMIRV